MVMRAGRLHEVVDIKRKTVARNEVGEDVIEWVTIEGGAAIYAGIEPLSGRESAEATQIHAEITARIIIRYMKGIRASMRVYHGDDVYELVSPPIDKMTRREYLTLLCKWVEPSE